MSEEFFWLAGAVLWNGAAFLAVWKDKRRARQGGWRIRERDFFLWAAAFGALGILAGMYVFRHKTRHLSFVWGMPILLLGNLMAGIAWLKG